MDMSGGSGRPAGDWGWCTCLPDISSLTEQFTVNNTLTPCVVPCGGVKAEFPPYICGSTTPEIGTLYYKRGGKAHDKPAANDIMHVSLYWNIQ